MFTGIIEETGRIKKIQKGRHSAVISIQAETVLEGTKVGDSIAAALHSEIWFREAGSIWSGRWRQMDGLADTL